jgi:uncharacterized protein (DUF2141 family)
MKHLFAAAAILAFGSAHAADLTIHVDDVKSADGTVNVALYDSADTFLRKPLQAIQAKAQKGAVTVQLKDLAPGDYAVAVYHDANGNGKMDRNMMGIPSEDYAFSNNAMGKMGPPQFDDARLAVPAAGLDTRVSLR